MKFKESKLVQDKTKLIATIKQILKPSNTLIKVEGGKDDSMVVTITKSDIDFVSNYAKVQTTVPNPAVIRVSQSIPGLKLQFDGEAYTVFHKLLNALSKEGLTLDKSTTPFISFKIIPKTFKYTGNNEQGLMEDAKQLIQNPILKVFDQFGKQYLAQVLDASLNKMIQAAARRGVKVTVPQLIAEIKDNPNGSTSQALFKAMATVIKQVSAQIPTIVTKNVSSISESVSTFKNGTMVKIINGEYAGSSGVVYGVDDEGLVSVDLDGELVWVKKTDVEVVTTTIWVWDMNAPVMGWKQYSKEASENLQRRTISQLKDSSDNLTNYFVLSKTQPTAPPPDDHKMKCNLVALKFKKGIHVKYISPLKNNTWVNGVIMSSEVDAIDYQKSSTFFTTFMIKPADGSKYETIKYEFQHPNIKQRNQGAISESHVF